MSFWFNIHSYDSEMLCDISWLFKSQEAIYYVVVA